MRCVGTGGLRGGAGAERAAPGEVAGSRDAVEIADAVGQEQGVVVAEAGGVGGQVGVALAARAAGEGCAEHAASQRPARRLGKRSPQVGHRGVADIGGVLGGDRAGAVRIALAVGAIGTAEGVFKERLRGGDEPVGQRAGSGRDREVGLGVRIGEGLAAEGGHVRHGIQVARQHFVADHASDIADFQAHLLRHLALNGHRDVVGAFGTVLGVEPVDVAGARGAVDAGEEGLRQGRRKP